MKLFQDATRCLVSIVSMYLMSQSLQIVIIFWEVLHKDSLEKEFTVFYSYANDAISIMTLLSSCLRLPVYCAWNKPIASAAALTLRQVASLCKPSSRCIAASSKNYDPGYRSVLYSNKLQQSNGNLCSPSPNQRESQLQIFTNTGVVSSTPESMDCDEEQSTCTMTLVKHDAGVNELLSSDHEKQAWERQQSNGRNYSPGGNEVRLWRL